MRRRLATVACLPAPSAQLGAELLGLHGEGVSGPSVSRCDPTRSSCSKCYGPRGRARPLSGRHRGPRRSCLRCVRRRGRGKPRGVTGARKARVLNRRLVGRCPSQARRRWAAPGCAGRRQPDLRGNRRRAPQARWSRPPRRAQGGSKRPLARPRRPGRAHGGSPRHRCILGCLGGRRLRPGSRGSLPAVRQPRNEEPRRKRRHRRRPLRPPLPRPRPPRGPPSRSRLHGPACPRPRPRPPRAW